MKKLFFHAHVIALFILGMNLLAEDITVPFFVIVPKGDAIFLALRAVQTDPIKANEFILKPTASAVYDKDASEKTRDDAVQETTFNLVGELNRQKPTPAHKELFTDDTGSTVYQANEFKFENIATIYVSVANMQEWVRQGAETNFVLDGKTYKVDKTLLEQWGKIEKKMLEKPKEEESHITPDTITIPAEPGAIDKFSQTLFRLAHGG